MTNSVLTSLLKLLNLTAQCDSPLPAHVQQEDVEARLLLLHQLQDALHTQAVGRAVRVGSVHRHHEAVAVVLVSVAGVVQQT